VDGVVIASADFTDPMVTELVQSDLPVATIDHVFNNRIAVLSDNLMGMDALVRFVAAKGHRKIALIHGESTSVTVGRLTGFHRACEELGIQIPDKWIRQGVFHDPKSCGAITRELLADPERPTCIFFPDDYSCIGGLNAIHDAGLRVPEDISAVGYDGIPLSRIVSPVLATWRQDTEALGTLATARLIEQIEHPRTAILDRVIVEGRLQEGGSVRQIC
jgi:DNA-binding LacI/PurR family transcriptional regulator